MYCVTCGTGVEPQDCFCSQCGARTETSRSTMVTRRLMLDKRNKKIAGVCAGFARYFDVDVVLVRVIWLAFALSTGIGFLAYIAAWMIMPSDHGLEPDRQLVPQPQTS
jgi:phage shock protein C